MIIGLEDNDGHWRESEKDIKDVVLNYFSSLFCLAQLDERDIQRVVKCVNKKKIFFEDRIVIPLLIRRDSEGYILVWALQNLWGLTSFISSFFRRIGIL